MAHEVKEASMASIQSGGLLRAANAYIAKVCGDVITRDRVGEAREVTIKIKVKPDIANNDGVNRPEIDWSVGYKIPGASGTTTRGFIDTGKVMVNQMDFNFPEQTSLGGAVDEVLGDSPPDEEEAP